MFLYSCHFTHIKNYHHSYNGSISTSIHHHVSHDLVFYLFSTITLSSSLGVGNAHTSFFSNDSKDATAPWTEFLATPSETAAFEWDWSSGCNCLRLHHLYELEPAPCYQHYGRLHDPMQNRAQHQARHIERQYLEMELLKQRVWEAELQYRQELCPCQQAYDDEELYQEELCQSQQAYDDEELYQQELCQCQQAYGDEELYQDIPPYYRDQENMCHSSRSQQLPCQPSQQTMPIYARPQFAYQTAPGLQYSPALQLPYGITSPADQLFYGFPKYPTAYGPEVYPRRGLTFMPIACPWMWRSRSWGY
jgi:hypothetical protein